MCAFGFDLKKALYEGKSTCPWECRGWSLERSHSICFHAYIKGWICTVVEEGMSGPGLDGSVLQGLWNSARIVPLVPLIMAEWDRELGQGVFSTPLMIYPHHPHLVPATHSYWCITRMPDGHQQRWLCRARKNPGRPGAQLRVRTSHTQLDLFLGTLWPNTATEMYFDYYF